MIISLVKRDLKGRYKESVLGFLWMLVNPLLQLVVYTIVFSTVMKTDIEKFYLFLFVALVPWVFFSTCLSAGTTIVLGQQDMIKKIFFPRAALPIAFTTSQFVNMILSFIIVLIVVLFSGNKINFVAWIFLPVIWIIEYALCLGVTLIVSSLNIYIRDLEHIMGVVSMAWMYLTPVIYSIDMVPEKYLGVFYLNPMTSVINVYRDILYYSRIPQTESLLRAGIAAFVVLLLGSLMFEKLQKGFAEEL